MCEKGLFFYRYVDVLEGKDITIDLATLNIKPHLRLIIFSHAGATLRICIRHNLKSIVTK